MSSSSCLKGKCAIVTGGSRGLGREIAARFLNAGSDVCLCARNSIELEKAVSELKKLACLNEARVIGIQADISVDEEVDALFERTYSQFGKIDILVNNAGIQGEMGLLKSADWHNWKKTVEVNLFGTVNCIRHGVDLISKGKNGGKIINISGGGATGSRPFFSAYAASKTAIVRMTEIIADEVKDLCIDVNAIAPGAMNTSMTREVLNLGETIVGSKEFGTAQKLVNNDNSVMERAADLALFLASDKSDGISGRLISAVWDDWEHMGDQRNEIMNGSLYTLRRIVP